MLGFSSVFLPVGIPVPDTAMGARNQLTVTVWRRNDTAIADSCTHGIGQPTIAVQVSVAEFVVQSNVVRISWQYTDPGIGDIVIWRRSGTTPWAAVATPALGSDGLVHYNDTTVQPGYRYFYRFGYRLYGTQAYSSELSVDVPGATLSILGATPNPTVGALRISFSLPNNAPARAEVFDLAGRRVNERELPASPGAHVENLAQGRTLAAGIYVVKLLASGREPNRARRVHAMTRGVHA